MKNTLMLIILLSCISLSAAIPNRNDFMIRAAVIETDSGTIKLAFFENEAPEHVRNFKKLIKEKVYEGIKFHRIIPDFMIQAGDPGTKDEDYPEEKYGSQSHGEKLAAEIGKVHFRGALAAARLGDEINPKMKSSGSQFYICVKSQPKLDGKYTVFGRVVAGIEVIDKISTAARNEKDLPASPLVIRKTYFESFFDKEKYEWAKRNRSGSNK